MTATKDIAMRALCLMLALCVTAGVAAAQEPGAGSAPAAAGSAEPAGSAAGSAAPAPPPAAAADPAPAAGEPANAAELRKVCGDAMNANETFARSIIQTALKRDLITVETMCAGVDTIKAHQDAVRHIEKNERHVIGAYAAMWVIAALFLLYLLQRQQRLKAEIAQLRRDLDAAAKDGKADA